jgi:hypothetical protein
MHKTSLITTVVLMGLTLVFWGCGGDDGPVTTPMPSVTVGTVSGYVKDTAGNALTGVTIQAAQLTTPTDAEGYFNLADVPTGDQVVVISSEGFAPNYRRATILEGARTYLPDVTLMAVESYEIEAATGGAVATADNRCAVTFQPNSFVTTTGSAYSGTVTVKLQAALPGDTFFDCVFPGRFEGILTDGSTVLVQSFGFADISIYDNTQGPLQLAPGTAATLRLDTDPAQSASAPASIPLWYLDPTDGQWHEEGAAILEGDSYTGAVAHFSAWNVDQLRPGASVCRVEGILRDTDGNPLPGGVVKGRVPDGGIGDEIISGSDGQFSLRGAADEPFQVWAIYEETVSEPVSVVLTGDCPFSLDITFNDFVPTSTVELDWDSAAVDLYTHFYVPMTWDDGQDPDYDLYHVFGTHPGVHFAAPYALLTPHLIGLGGPDRLLIGDFVTGTSEFWVSGGAFSQTVLENSGATVEVTIGLTTWNFAVADVPTGGSHAWSWWHVFDLTTNSAGGVEVVPVMSYADEYPPDNIWPDADNTD